MNTIKAYAPLVAVIIGSILLVFLFFGAIVTNPSGYVFGAGDGVKNYYSVLYQVVHGEGYHFDGMLYPYGDQLTYADGQPVLTTVFRALFEPSVNNGLIMMGSMNLIMIFSLVICALFIFLILRKANVPPWFSVPFALIIAFLSPQIQRFTGHYALAYTFYVPMLWWMIIRLSESGSKWGWSLLYCTAVILFSLNQPYHLLFSLALGGSIFGYAVFRSVAFKTDKSNLPWLALITIVPAILLSLFFSTIEFVQDRPLAPYGFGAYESNFRSVFLPTQGPAFEFLKGNLLTYWPYSQWEGQGYVGIPGTIFLLLLLWKIGLDLRKKGWRAPFLLSSPKVIRQALIPSVFILLISAGALNRLGFLWLSDHIVALKQFRSLGRLVWIFYYVFTVSAVVYFFTLYRAIGIRKYGRIRSMAFLIGVFSLWALDVWPHADSVNQRISQTKAKDVTFCKTISTRLTSSGYPPEHFQSVLSIPFDLVGSEKIGLHGSASSFTNAANVSFSMGLPMFGGLMSRTSMAATQKQAQLVADPLIEREIFQDLPNGKPFLVVHSEGALSKGEKFLLDQAELIVQEPGFRILSLNPEKLRASLETYRSTTDRTSFNWFEFPEPAGYSVLELHIEREQVVLDTSLTIEGKSTPIELSYWLLIDRKSTGLPEVNMIISRPDRTDTTLIRPSDFADLMNGWVRVHHIQELPPGTSNIKLENTTRSGNFWNPTVKYLNDRESELVVAPQ